MNRRLGISIWGVLSLTMGVLIAEYAFAPLRDSYPAADTAVPASDAEPTARPKEAETPAERTPRKLPPLRLERRSPAGEAQGDPMYAAVSRPLFDAVWQENGEAPRGSAPFRVSLVSTASLAGEPAAGATSAAGAGFTGLGGTFLGTQRRERALALQNGSSPAETTADEAGAAPPGDTEGTPETKSMSSEPSVPGAAGGSPPSEMPASTGAVTGGEEASSPTSLPPASRDEQPIRLDDAPPPPLPHVTVPEPLPGSLLLVGLILGVLSRRRGHA